MDQSTVNADLVDNDEQSLISQLLEKPALFLEITEQERNAIEHLCAALELVKTTDSTECPTLGAQKELYPLVSSFKRFKMGVAGGALKAAEKEAAAEAQALKEQEEMAAQMAASLRQQRGSMDSVEDMHLADAFSFEPDEDEISPEDEELLDKIQKLFLSLSRNPKTRKPNFKRIFEELDSDGSGTLQTEELGKAMEMMGIDLTEEEVVRLTARLDIDGDGDINYMEFIRFVKVGGEEGDGRTATDKLEDALTHVSRAIFLYSDHNFFMMRAELYLRLHDLKSCTSNLRYVLKMLPGDQDTRKRLAKVLDLQGINWLGVGNAAAAETCFSDSCKMDPVNASFWVHKSIALVYDRNCSEALRAVEQAMAVEAPTADIFCLRGKIHWALNLIDSGNRDFRSAQDLEPDHPEVVSFISTMIKRSGDYYKEAMLKLQQISMTGKNEEETRDAIRLLTQALNLVPDDMRLLVLRSKAFRSVGDLEKSLKDIDDATFHYLQSMLGNEVPKFVPNRRMWLETQSMKNNYREPAILTQQRSLTLNEMAMVEVKDGNYVKAISLLNRVIEEEYKLHDNNMTKVDAKFFINRGDCYRATGKIEQAMSDFHRAFDSDPNNWQTKTRLSMIHYMAGLQLFNEGLYNPAEIEFTVAIKYNRKVSGYWASRGKACFYQYNYDGAFEDFKEALKLDPNNADVLSRMQQFDPDGKVLEEVGVTKQGGSGVVGNLGADLGGGRNVPRPPPRQINVVPAPNRLSRTLAPPSKIAPPSLTPLTSVNPHMAKAGLVKSYVDSKRLAMSQTLSVNQRRSMHPIKKGDHWSVMESKKVVYKSMSERKKMLDKQKKKGKKKHFNQKKDVRLGASSKGIF
ncbi:hypothetical protein TrST_g8031 [Triparma strigata]|uniref:EF-hand domain-containing protein n=1 Tax=Triparma strigata TaxID=1606541 RepID=A0A9W7B360_9STRA|nr:hypothetical protein TrST_g8031 [Triparma strigata]